MPRPRLLVIPHVPPSEQEIEFRAYVHCSECDLDWSAAFADRRTGRCVNHLRALHREEKEVRAARLYRLFGITHEDQGRIVEEQGRACAICRDSFDEAVAGEKRQRPVVDHDHATGHFRAFLCGRCNSGLGFFLDAPERLQAAAAYIATHRARIAKLPATAKRHESKTAANLIAKRQAQDAENARVHAANREAEAAARADDLKREERGAPRPFLPGKSFEDAFAAMTKVRNETDKRLAAEAAQEALPRRVTKAAPEVVECVESS